VSTNEIHTIHIVISVYQRSEGCLTCIFPVVGSYSATTSQLQRYICFLQKKDTCQYTFNCENKLSSHESY